MCINVNDVVGILDAFEFNPRFITEDSCNRKQMYMNDINRNKDNVIILERNIGDEPKFPHYMNVITQS